MHRLFLLLKVCESCVDPIRSQGVKSLARYESILLNQPVEFIAFFAHKLTAELGGRVQHSQSPITAEVRAAIYDKYHTVFGSRHQISKNLSIRSCFPSGCRHRPGALRATDVPQSLSAPRSYSDRRVPSAGPKIKVAFRTFRAHGGVLPEAPGGSGG